MFKTALAQLKMALILLVSLVILTGIIYPFAVTAVAQLVFPKQANGSLIEQNNKTMGSSLIGQSFTNPNYFWGRPSATTPFPYNGESSGGSNSGPSNPAFLDTVRERLAHLRQFNPENHGLIPVDLVTASGSGLDPDISPFAAFYQVPRIAKMRHLSENEVRELVLNHIKNRTLLILGEPRVNVLELNLALDKLRSDGVKKSS